MSNQKNDKTTNLTTKQLLFVDEYMTNGFNATQAALKAGYSETTARSQGQRLLTNVDVKEEINKRCQDITAEFPLLRKRIVEKLQRVAFSDIADYLEYKTVKTEIANIDGKPILGFKTVIEMKDSDQVDTGLISEIQETRDGFRFKRMDPIKALELLAKFTGLDNADREEILDRIERLEEVAEAKK